jgi:hypothetical protein
VSDERELAVPDPDWWHHTCWRRHISPEGYPVGLSRQAQTAADWFLTPQRYDADPNCPECSRHGPMHRSLPAVPDPEVIRVSPDDVIDPLSYDDLLTARDALTDQDYQKAWESLRYANLRTPEADAPDRERPKYQAFAIEEVADAVQATRDPSLRRLFEEELHREP